MGSKVDYTSLSDEELIFLLKESDHAAFTEIYWRYSYSMISHACRKLGEKDLAKDLVQELFANLWNRREQQLPATYLESYLYKSLKHKILDYFAHENVKAKYTADIHTFKKQINENTDYLIREKQLKKFIEAEIQALPPKTRVIFEMSRYQQLSHKEIADRLGTNEINVTKHISNAIKILKSKLHPMIWICISVWLR